MKFRMLALVIIGALSTAWCGNPDSWISGLTINELYPSSRGGKLEITVTFIPPTPTGSNQSVIDAVTGVAFMYTTPSDLSAALTNQSVTMADYNIDIAKAMFSALLVAKQSGQPVSIAVFSSDNAVRSGGRRGFAAVGIK